MRPHVFHSELVGLRFEYPRVFRFQKERRHTRGKGGEGRDITSEVGDDQYRSRVLQQPSQRMAMHDVTDFVSQYGDELFLVLGE